MAANDDDHRLRQGPDGLSIAPANRRGRVRLSLTPAEERRRLVELERTEQMLTEDLRMASALLEMIEQKTLDRDAKAMSPKQIQYHFIDAQDRASSHVAVGRVLHRVGVLGDANQRVLPYMVLDAEMRIEALIEEDRVSLKRVKLDLGKA